MKASIVIPAYRHDYFEQCLNSALGQSGGVGEIIICDDSSEFLIEKTVNLALKISSVPIRYFKNTTRLGEGINFFKGISLASFPYIKPLHDDDLIQPECVERLVNIFETHENISLATVRRNSINSRGEHINTTDGFNFDLTWTNKCIKSSSVLRLLAKNTVNWIGEPTCVMFRRDDLLSLGENYNRINENVTFGCGDLTTWVNLLKFGDLGIAFGDYLASHRLWDQSTTNLHFQNNFSGIAMLHEYLNANIKMELVNEVHAAELNSDHFSFQSYHLS